MAFVLSFFRDGGPFMYLILTASLPAWGLVMVLAILRVSRKKIPDIVWFVGPAVFILLGSAGFSSGMRQALKAVAMASAEHKAPMLAAGTAVSTYPDLFGLQIAGLLAGTGCLATGIATWREATTNGIAAVRLGLVALLGLLGVVAATAGIWTFFLIAALVVAAGATGLAVARKPADTDLVVAPGGTVTAGLGLLTLFCIGLQGIGVARVQVMKDRAVSRLMGPLDLSGTDVELLQANVGAAMVLFMAGLVLLALAMVRRGGAAPLKGVVVRGLGAVGLVLLLSLLRFAVMDGFVVDGLALTSELEAPPPAPTGR